ncbi:MAG: hypothetical protein J5994_08680 [Ruminococcus sp.]|nr:hypothetical protein [Ruminococcus sp.]
MLTNADMTVYEKDSYKRHIIKSVYWNDSRGRTVTKNGAQISDSIVVYIYSEGYVPRAGDMIVKGLADFEFDGSSEKAASGSMKLFRAAFPGFAVVKTVNDFRFGGLAHIEITAQ